MPQKVTGATYFHIYPFGDELQKLPALQSDVVGNWYVEQRFFREPIIHRHDLVGSSPMIVHLAVFDFLLVLLGQAFVLRLSVVATLCFLASWRTRGV